MSAEREAKGGSQLMPLPQVAQRVGRCSRTIRNWIGRGLLSAVRINNRLYLRMAEVEQLCGDEPEQAQPESED